MRSFDDCYEGHRVIMNKPMSVSSAGPSLTAQKVGMILGTPIHLQNDISEYAL